MEEQSRDFNKVSSETISEVIQETLERLKTALADVDAGLKALILFGSASRPEDFSPYYSSIDILALLDKKLPVHSLTYVINTARVLYPINLLALTVDEFNQLIDSRDILVTILLKDSKVVYGAEFMNKIVPPGYEPISTHSINQLRALSMYWLCLSAESLLKGYYYDTPHYIYKTIRDATRYYCAKKYSKFIRCDKDILRFIRENSPKPSQTILAKCFSISINARKGGKVDRSLAYHLINLTSNHIGVLIDKNIDAFEKFIRKLPPNSIIIKINLAEEKDTVKWEAKIQDLSTNRILSVS